MLVPDSKVEQGVVILAGKDDFKMVFLDPHSLKPHPLNSWLYEEREDSDFLDSIRRLGVLEPLVVNRDGVILSGHRRWKAALKLGFKSVPCVVEEFENEKVAIVELNRQRVKTPREIYREAQILKQELKPKAKERESLGDKLKKKGFSNLRNLDPVHVDKEVSKRVGVSTGQLYMIDYIYSHEDEAKDIVEKLDRGEISVHQAYNKMKSRIEKPVEPEEEESEGWKCPICHNEYLVEKPVTLKICPYCDMEFQAWKAAKDYEKQVATMG